MNRQVLPSECILQEFDEVRIARDRLADHLLTDPQRFLSPVDEHEPTSGPLRRLPGLHGLENPQCWSTETDHMRSLADFPGLGSLRRAGPQPGIKVEFRPARFSCLASTN